MWWWQDARLSCSGRGLQNKCKANDKMQMLTTNTRLLSSGSGRMRGSGWWCRVDGGGRWPMSTK